MNKIDRIIGGEVLGLNYIVISDIKNYSLVNICLIHMHLANTK
jgi:hypothetical protein